MEKYRNIFGIKYCIRICNILIRSIMYVRKNRFDAFRLYKIIFSSQPTINDLYEIASLENFYKFICKDGRSALNRQDIEIDPYINKVKNDSRRGLTLVARPTNQIAKQLSAITKLLSKIAPGQLFYKPSQFHLTIISLIKASKTFSVEMVPIETYDKVIRKALSIVSPFKINFVGVGATRSSIIVKGYPDFNIQEIRYAVRNMLKSVGLEKGIDERYRRRGVHITIARFQTIENFVLLNYALKELDSTYLGSMFVYSAQLVLNDIFMNPEKSKIIKEIKIGKNSYQN